MKESELEKKLSLGAVKKDKRWFNNKALYAAEILEILLKEIPADDTVTRISFKKTIHFLKGYEFEDE